jgi:hypothetical protein
VGADRLGVPSDRNNNTSAGFIAVLCAAVLSGFAGKEAKILHPILHIMYKLKVFIRS